MPEGASGQNVSSTWVDHIPLIWIEPSSPRSNRRIVIFLTHLGGTKEEMIPFLHEIAAKGSFAASFDPYQHGERGREEPEEIFARVFAGFRRQFWPMLGQTTVDVLRVIDWAVAEFGVDPHVLIGGISMGGDISVAAAGIDHRIDRVGAVIATPDWLRPGMHDAGDPGKLLPPGEADAYAQFFYDTLNPLTHLEAYSHGPSIRFFCGEKDTHVPPDGAFRFKEALRKTNGAAAAHVKISVMPGVGHMDADPKLWWKECLQFLTAS